LIKGHSRAMAVRFSRCC